jgi:hypothetical protein
VKERGAAIKKDQIIDLALEYFGAGNGIRIQLA